MHRFVADDRERRLAATLAQRFDRLRSGLSGPDDHDVLRRHVASILGARGEPKRTRCGRGAPDLR
ncbi:MAG: hypothetical protein AMXMBFR37_26800 [Steroidobacteraceae bacterium]